MFGAGVFLFSGLVHNLNLKLFSFVKKKKKKNSATIIWHASSWVHICTQKSFSISLWRPLTILSFMVLMYAVGSLPKIWLSRYCACTKEYDQKYIFSNCFSRQLSAFSKYLCPSPYPPSNGVAVLTKYLTFSKVF